MINVDNDMFVFGRYETINIRVKSNPTNGEVIKAVFPETIIYDDIYVMHIGIGRTDMNFRKEWWNAPYKKGENNG